MPTVPPLLSPTEQLSGATPSVNLAVPTDAFGGSIGNALSGLGQTIDKVGNELWSRAVELQNLNNDTEAKKADTAYMIKAGELHAKYSSLEGNAARDALPQYMQDQQAARESIRDGLSNPMAQKMYDASSMSFMGRNIFNAAGHAAQQTKVAAVNASKSRVSILTDNIGENPNDDTGTERSINAIRAETRSQGQQGGWSEDQITATTDSNVSSAISTRIASLARTDPFGAQTMFDTAVSNKALSPVDTSKVQASIQTQSRQVISRNIASQVNADLDHPEDGNPQKSLADRIAEAKSDPTVQRFAKNDPLLPDFVEQRVIADYNRSKAITRDFSQQNEQTVAGAMMTGNKEGILPKSVEELQLINPEVASAWNNLKPTTQRKYMTLLADNAKGEKVAWTNDTLTNYQKLKGMAVDSPVEFLAHDVITENMPASGKKELIGLQQRLRAQSQTDPRVGRAMQILGPDLQAAGISKTGSGDKDAYFQFVGSLQDALDDYQKNSAKVPGVDEIRTIGARLMQEQVTSKGYLWDSKSPLYSLPLPDEDAERLKADPYWAKAGITPNDSQLKRIYVAQKYKELYGGAAKKPAEAAFPPNAPVSK